MVFLVCFLVIIAAFGYIHYQLVYVQAESIVKAFQATILDGPANSNSNKTASQHSIDANPRLPQHATTPALRS